MKKNRDLVIVESPTKAKTISGFLGRNYKCVASIGHIRDLPRSSFGVKIPGFEPHYVVPRTKSKIVSEIKKLVKMSDTVYIATDEDREGEAIGWHLLEITKPKNYQRISFHEITKTAIKDALKNPRKINQPLVEAQEARRILDRVVGYKISPILSKKIAHGLSAGRVQSVALKIIVDREREIKDFAKQTYFVLLADIKIDAVLFEAKLIKISGKKIDPGVENRSEAEKIKLEAIEAQFIINSISRRKIRRSPFPPLTTSRLQQIANTRLGYSPSVTMRIAQSLYEGKMVNGVRVGLITYMRTDSVSIAKSARDQARVFIKANYGDKFLPNRDPVYKNRSSAQLAHEAIRPTDINRSPDRMNAFLDSHEQKLYKLIWNLFIESQMANAVSDSMNIKLSVNNTEWTTGKSTLYFPGWMIIEGKKAEIGIKQIKDNDEVKLLKIKMDEKETQPLPRYNAASLIKKLEDEGIGRPSTYATVVSTLLARSYVMKKDRAFIPNEVSYKVIDRLVEYFPTLMNLKFTAHFEELLDNVAEGQLDKLQLLNEFWGPFSKQMDEALNMPSLKPPDIVTDEKCPNCGKELVIRTGRYGKFFACSGFPECKYTRSVENEVEKTDKLCPKCGKELVKKRGRYGEFVACSGYPECKFSARETKKSCRCGQLLYKITKVKGSFCLSGQCSLFGKIQEKELIDDKKE